MLLEIKELATIASFRGGRIHKRGFIGYRYIFSPQYGQQNEIGPMQASFDHFLAIDQ